VLVVGTSGSGKTTAARAVAARWDLPFSEMDTLAIGPGWSTPADFVQRVTEIVTGPRWVLDSWGSAEVRAQMWARADTVVWLDYPRRVVLPRLFRRSFGRSWTREPLFGGNVETWGSWLTKDHPLVHAVTTFEKRRRIIGRLAASSEVEVVRLELPRELDDWLGR
jgi:adenylate kinase family enzyme